MRLFLVSLIRGEAAASMSQEKAKVKQQIEFHARISEQAKSNNRDPPAARA